MRKESLREQLNELPSCIQAHLYIHGGGGVFCSLFLQEFGLTILIHSVKITEEKFINNRVKSWPLS